MIRIVQAHGNLLLFGAVFEASRRAEALAKADRL